MKINSINFKELKVLLLVVVHKCLKLNFISLPILGLSSSMSGTTCTLMYMPLQPNKEGKRKLYLAHVGDSKAVMVSYDSKKGDFTGRDLTQDHKPCVPAEKQRIEANGGRVIFDGFYNYRVFARGQMYPGEYLLFLIHLFGIYN